MKCKKIDWWINAVKWKQTNKQTKTSRGDISGTWKSLDQWRGRSLLKYDLKNREKAAPIWNFFVNVGSSLAVNIPKATEDNAGINTIMENADCIFLCKVEKDEIINIVKDCANIGSTDWRFRYDINEEYNWNSYRAIYILLKSIILNRRVTRKNENS